MCNFVWLVAVFVFIVLSQVTAKEYSNLKQPVSYYPTEPAHEPEFNLEGCYQPAIYIALDILGSCLYQDLPSRAHSCWQDSCPSVKDGGGLPLTMAAIPGPLSVSLVINSLLLLSSHEHRHV